MKSLLQHVAGLKIAALDQGPSARLDLWVLGLLLLLACLRIASSTQVEFLPFHDMGSYRKMALDPAAYFAVAPHHAQRVLPSLIVWLMQAVSGLPVDDGFRLLSGLGYTTAHLLLYMLLRHFSLSPILALPTVLMASLAQWPVGFSLRDIWQACDAWTYALSAAIFLLASRNHLRGLIFLTVASVLVRQNLAVLGIAAFAHLAISYRSIKPLLGLAVVILAFALNTFLAGGGAQQVLADHLVGGLVHIDNLPALAIDMSLPWLLLPFAPLLLVPRSLVHLARHWWVLIFSAATVVQALLVAKVGGIENTQRLLMPAIWILIPLAALTARDVFSSVRLQIAYAFLPFTLLISRWLLAETPYSAWHNFRLVPALYLVLLILVAWRSTRGAGGKNRFNFNSCDPEAV